MVNQSFLISNINALKDNFSINAKVVHLWRQYYYGGDTLDSMDMILMDQEGLRISATIGHKMVSQLDSLLKEDVIGHVATVGDVVHGERKGKKNRRMVVELTNIEGLKLKCTLWDAFINDFKTRMESSSDYIKVCVFQFESVQSANVLNTFYSSRFFIDEEIPEIDDFRTRLLARVSDDTSSLQVSNLTSESSQALEEKSFFYGTKYVNIEQLMDVPCACVALATITSIEYEEGWVYIACCECNCKAVPNEDESSSKKDGKRLILQVRVSDDLACASFLMFDLAEDVLIVIDDESDVEVDEYKQSFIIKDTKDLLGEVISWEYEMQECEVNRTKQKPLFIQLKNEVDLELTCFAFSNLADKLNEYISSLKSTEKFSVMIKNARIYVDHKGLNFHTIPSYFVRRHRINKFKFAVIRYGLQDFEMNLLVTLIMRSKRTIKPVKIFDNYVTNSIRNKNNQKNSTKKKRNIISNEMNDLNDMVDVEGGDVKEEVLTCEEDEMVNNNGKESMESENEQIGTDRGGKEKREENVDRLKGNNDHKENINSGSTYAKMVTKDMQIVNNKLDFMPTEINEDGSEIVIFDEDLVDKGSVQWKLTVCDMKNDGTCMFKFRNEARMNKVLEQGPWIVNNKPMFVRKWDPTIGMEKIEQSKVPLWVSLVNVPLEAWSKEGISALASSLGKPLIMDTMTAKRCSLGEGRMDFARILVEFDVMKGFKEERLKYSIETKTTIRKRRSVDELEEDARKKEEIIRKKNEENKGSDGRKTYDEIRNKRDIWKRKEVNKGKQNNSRGKEQEKEGNDKDERDGIRSRNKFEVLNGMATNNEELEILKGGMIVDVFFIKKTKPSCIEVKDLTQDMMNYYKNQLEIYKLKDMEDGNEDIEDVLETNSGIAKDLSTEEVEDLKIGMWNIRSLNQKKRQKSVLNFIKEENINICRIIETHIKLPKLSKVASMVFGGWDWVSNSVFSTNGCRIMIGWDKKQGGCNGGSYDKASDVLKEEMEEHSAGGSRINRDMQEFRECVHDIEVDDINCTDLFYTWIKSPSKPKTSILKKLDRVMVNSEFINVYGSAYARFHPFLIYDHSPVVIHLPNTLERKKKSFKFSNFVVDKADFLDVNVRKLEEELKRTQVDVEANPNCKVVKENLSEVLHEYNEALNDNEKLLAQKAKVKWLSEGDKNTKYFHNVVKSIMHSNRSMRVCDDKGKWFEGDDVADQFKITDKEIKEAMFGNGNDKAPGPDGFTAICFKKSWDIMGMDVCGAVKEIFNSNKLLGKINATLITLVPKIHQPNKVSDYRPVACCNVIYKCISKIITKRLQGCLDKLVSINQSAFVPGRLIQDNALITQELLKGYNRKSGPRRCALKIDIAKAYDIVNWDFLKQILTYFGFHEKIIGWIMTCVTSATFTVCVNGGKYGYFKNRRGLRQGEPTLITSVLASIHIYRASVFLIPKTTVKDIEKALKGFLWCHGDLKKGAAKVAWKLICAPKSQGGLGIKRLGPWNKALLFDIDESDSGTWKAILNPRNVIRDSIWKEIGDGRTTNVWFDKWSNEGPICDIIPFKKRYEARMDEKASVADMLVNGVWNWPKEWETQFRSIKDIQIPTLREGEHDCLIWKDHNGNKMKFSVGSVWEKLREEA
ncbi:RNA-directed DNA polymerase, eukaryota, reverse transcriptase zinc-binding domain protein [Tanacetum coccineum]